MWPDVLRLNRSSSTEKVRDFCHWFDFEDCLDRCDEAFILQNDQVSLNGTLHSVKASPKF